MYFFQLNFMMTFEKNTQDSDTIFQDLLTNEHNAIECDSSVIHQVIAEIKLADSIPNIV